MLNLKMENMECVRGIGLLDMNFWAIACWDMGHDLDLYEIDKDYFEAGKRRLENHQKQQVLF